MGQPFGFLTYNRAHPSLRETRERVSDYREVYCRLSEREIVDQAARCMDCGIPFCHSLGCPLGNLIPEWNDAVYRGHWREAYKRLEKTNNFPEITGRICPAPCEASCTLSISDDPVAIKDDELTIIEHAFREGWVEPRVPEKETGIKVAVIGSGPAGLVAAQQLRRAGHAVTVFEKDEKPGGILRYGIPDFKLEKWVLERRLDQLVREGVQFENGVVVGEDISVRYLQKKFDYLLITTGSSAPRDLPVTGRGYEGVHFAMDFLTASNRYVSGERSLQLAEDPLLNCRGKRVLVLGGGDTGSDCVGTAVRQGAAEVYQFEIMPKPQEWEESWNPQWPDWPRVLRTSSSHLEGCTRDWGIETVRFSGRGVAIEEAFFVRVDARRNTRTGRMEFKRVPGSEFSLKVDKVLLALGFLHTEHNKLVQNLGVKLDSRGNIAVNNDYQTSITNVFAAGDATTGAALVVRAMYHGREAGNAVNRVINRGINT